MPSPTESVAAMFSMHLRHYLDRSPFNETEVIRRAEIDHGQVHNLLQGTQIPRLDTVVKLAGALEVKPHQLIEGITWRPSVRGEGRFEELDGEGSG